MDFSQIEPLKITSDGSRKVVSLESSLGTHRSVAVVGGCRVAVSAPNEQTTKEMSDASDGTVLLDQPEVTPDFVERNLGSSFAGSVTSSFADELEAEYILRRHEIVSADGFINTPLGVLRDVAREYGTPIHMEFHEVQISRIDKRFRVEVYAGRLKGIFMTDWALALTFKAKINRIPVWINECLMLT